MEHLNPDTLNGITALTNNRIEIFGGSYSRDIVIMAVMAVLFFLGVIIGCVLKLNGKARPLEVLLGSIFVFFLSTPVSARVLSGDWGTTTIGAVDQIIEWIKNSGEMPNAFFAFGVVMIFGLMSWPLFQLVLRFLRRMLAFLDTKAKPPAGSNRAPT
jgi:uncharacterized membrane protein